MRLSRIVELARFYRQQRFVGFNVPHTPCFDEESTLAFTELLLKAKSYVEFGSGGSTLLANSLGVPTVTVESDRFFARAVVENLARPERVQILSPNIGLTVEWGKPMIKRITRRRVARWRRYIEAPWSLSNPDLVLIDGRFRRACALRAAIKAAVSGKRLTLFFDDYVDRDYYHDVECYLGRPQVIGRAALFLVSPENSISVGDVDSVARDYR